LQRNIGSSRPRILPSGRAFQMHWLACLSCVLVAERAGFQGLANKWAKFESRRAFGCA